MKRIATLILCAVISATVNAQETVVIITEPGALTPAEPYNRFALDAQFGFNHVVNPLADGYSVPTMGFFHVGLGGRYMLNPKFGMRLGINYDQITATDGSSDFTTDYYRSSLEGVINLGNLLRFDQWTQCFGLLLHAGMGYSVSTNAAGEGPDNMMNVVGGLTPQFRMGDRWNLYFDASMVSNANQDFTYDFSERILPRGLAGNLYNYSVGLQYNFGPHKRYADWIPGSDGSGSSDLRNRVEQLERDQMDSDNDGVVNHIDEEANTPAGAMVDTKGREIFWYDIYEEANHPEMEANFVRYINTYDILFETKKTDIDPRYNRMLDNIALAMNNNQIYKLSLVGHADAVGDHDFNLELSKRRAEAVKSYLVARGVAESRISTTGVGESQSVDPNETNAVIRELDRRVQFFIK